MEIDVPATASVSPTGNTYIDGVLVGTKWATDSLTFSFPNDPSFYGSGYGNGENLTAFEAFTAAQQAAVRSILADFSSVINFTFTEITETSSQHADLRYAESDKPSTAWAYYPSAAAAGGDAWFNNSSTWYDNPVQGNYAWLTILHETGHAMGLKHPQTAYGSFGIMPADRDSLEYTVMSYRSFIGGSTGGYSNEGYGYPQTLMMYDIAALQEMYGANYSTNSGDTVYRWDPLTGREFVDGVVQTAPGGNRILMTVWDGGGQDIYDFSNYATNLSVNLQPGAWTTASTAQLASLGGGHYATGNIANALLYDGNIASLIEHAIGGTGADTIVGNVADNRLTGGAGNDALDGDAGNDTAVYTGTMNEYQVVENSDGTWTVADLRAGAPDGTDTLRNTEYLQFLDTLEQIGTAPVVNQAPTITSGTQSASLTEWTDRSSNETANTPHVASGAVTFADGNATDSHTASFAARGTGYLGTFSIDTGNIDTNGSVGWSFSVTDKAIDYLKAGQKLTQYYDLTIDDGHGGAATQTVTVVLNGADDSITTKTSRGNKGGKSSGNDNDSPHGNDQVVSVHADRHHLFEDQLPAQVSAVVEPASVGVVDPWQDWLLA
jgi:serralysin